jgi:hypothetical protein
VSSEKEIFRCRPGDPDGEFCLGEILLRLEGRDGERSGPEEVLSCIVDAMADSL